MPDEPMTQAMLIGTLKAMKWEEAKGALRALMALDGSSVSSHKRFDEDGLMRFEVVEAAIEEFIKDFESRELYT